MQVIHFHIFLRVYFILRSGPYGELDGVLFDARHMEESLDYSANFFFLVFDVLTLKISYVRGIFNTFLPVVCGFNVYKIIFVFNEINRQKYFT